MLQNDPHGWAKSTGRNRAYPVETHTHYMLGVHSNSRRRRTLDVVGVGDNRIGTEYTIGNSPKEGRRGAERYRMRREGCPCLQSAVCKAGSAKTGPGQGPGNRMGFKDLKLGTRADKLVSARPGTTVC